MAFEDLNSRAEEEDWAITSTQLSWFTGFRNMGYKCVFLNGENIAEVVKVCEVLKS